MGYKGLLSQNFIVDLNFYYTSYTDFIGGDDVAAKFKTVHQNVNMRLVRSTHLTVIPPKM